MILLKDMIYFFS